ncbi:hypothetical protein AVEN_239755-1 [Araneus ventricosus]|uniref:Uncharacterized protein n=1 Tax=Araneus ventricosus TaxID=182803 RepID=A0A4Y2II04_ARAVE|nr:hypothetical protein AVEN_239755-1 [Araneus ventricosus]
MPAFMVKVIFLLCLCVLLYATVSEGILVKKLLKFLFEKRSVVLFPVPIPIFRKVPPPVRQASLELHHKEILPPPPDYFIPPPPPYPPFPPYDDFAYPYP